MKLKKLFSGMIASVMAVTTATSIAVFEASAEDIVPSEGFLISVYTMDETNWNWVNTVGEPLSEGSGFIGGVTTGDTDTLNAKYPGSGNLQFGGMIHLDPEYAGNYIPSGKELEATVYYEFYYTSDVSGNLIAYGTDTVNFTSAGAGKNILAGVFDTAMPEDVDFYVEVRDQKLVDAPVYDEWVEDNGSYTFTSGTVNQLEHSFDVNGENENIAAVLFKLDWKSPNGAFNTLYNGESTGYLDSNTGLTNGLNVIPAENADSLLINTWWLDNNNSITVSDIKSVPASDPIPETNNVLDNDAGFMQYGYDDNGNIYARYIQTVKYSELIKHSQANFEFTCGGVTKTGTSSTYYTALSYNNATYTCNDGYVIVSKMVVNAPGALTCKVTLS